MGVSAFLRKSQNFRPALRAECCRFFMHFYAPNVEGLSARKGRLPGQSAAYLLYHYAIIFVAILLVAILAQATFE